MRRREFIRFLGGAAMAWPAVARAQQPVVPVIGTLYPGSAAEWANQMDGLRRGLGETGFVEGRNVAFEYRWAEGHFERLPALVADLVDRKVAVILIGGNTEGVRAAMAATKTIPIVFTTGADPVASGFVASLNRPGSNATGFTLLNNELLPKRVELLHEVIPTATKVAFLVNPNNSATSQSDIKVVQAAARRFGLDVFVVKGGSESEIDLAFTTAVQQRAGALLLSSDAFLSSRRKQIAALGLRHALPTVSGIPSSAVAGLLMSYGVNVPDMYRQAGVYVGRIIKGEKPGDLPVQQPTKFELVVNLKTAKALGLNIPESFLLRADEVIE